jgi:hypothetical protein
MNLKRKPQAAIPGAKTNFLCGTTTMKILRHSPSEDKYHELQRLGCAVTRRIEAAQCGGNTRRVERLFKQKARLVSLMKHCPGRKSLAPRPNVEREKHAEQGWHDA